MHPRVPALASRDSTARIRRSTHLREPRRYLASAAGGPQWRPVPEADLPFEFAMNALRLTEGFPPPLFVERTGLAMDAISGRFQGLADEDLALWHNGRWQASPRGFQYLNEVVARFLPEPNSQTGADS